EQRAVGGLGQQVLRLPAGAAADRLGILQRLQEAVAEERIAGRAGRERAGIPLRGVDACQGIDDAQADGRGVVRHGGSIARIMPGRGQTKKVRQTEVAGQLRSFAFPPTQGAQVLHWLECANFEGGFRWAHEGPTRKPKGVWLEGPKPRASAYALTYLLLLLLSSLLL